MELAKETPTATAQAGGFFNIALPAITAAPALFRRQDDWQTCGYWSFSDSKLLFPCSNLAQPLHFASRALFNADLLDKGRTTLILHSNATSVRHRTPTGAAPTHLPRPAITRQTQYAHRVPIWPPGSCAGMYQVTRTWSIAVIHCSANV